MAILDQYGKPIETAQLQEPQTARIAHLHQEYENHPSRGLTPARLARILQQAEQGDMLAQHELFQDMEEKDAHLFSVMQTRRGAIQRIDWDVEPPPNATAAEKDMAAYAKDMLTAFDGDFQDLLFDMTDAVGHGFAALEVTWSRIERQLLPVKATHRPQAWFQTSTMPGADRNQLRLRDNSAAGAELWPFGWILHTHRSRSGYIARSGLYRVLAWPFLFRNYAIRDLAEFLEIYGLPLRLGTYSPAATKDDKAALLRAVVNIGHDAAAIIPQGMMIDFKESATGDNKSFDAMIGLMERCISKAVLGGTLTSGEGEHGTQALGSVHNDLRTDLRDGDARQVAATLTRSAIFPILSVNKGLADFRRCPRFVFDTQEPEDLKMYSDALPKLVGVGVRVPAAWAHDKLKIPEPKDGEAVLAVAAPAAAPAPGLDSVTKSTPAVAPVLQPGRRGQAQLKATAASEVDELDELAAEMAGEWEPALDPLYQPVAEALDQAGSIEEFRDLLEARLSAVDPAGLVDLLARGTFAARIWARLNGPQSRNA